MNKKVAIILFIALGTALTCRSAVFLNGQRVSYHFEKNVASGGPVSTNSTQWWVPIQYFNAGIGLQTQAIQNVTQIAGPSNLSGFAFSYTLGTDTNGVTYGVIQRSLNDDLWANLNAEYLNGHPASYFATNTPLYEETYKGIVETVKTSNATASWDETTHTLTIDTNAVHDGDTVDRIYSTRAVDETPVSNEYATAGYVRSLLIGGKLWYGTTNAADVGFGSTNVNWLYMSYGASYTNIIPVVSNGQYLIYGVTTQTYASVRSPITFDYWLGFSHHGGESLKVHPEAFYTYDLTNLIFLSDVGGQEIMSSDLEWYQYTLSFNDPGLTGPVYVVGALRVDEESSEPDLYVGMGSNVPSRLHIAAAGESSSGGGGAQTNEVNWWTTNQYFQGTTNYISDKLKIGGNAGAELIVTNINVQPGNRHVKIACHIDSIASGDGSAVIASANGGTASGQNSLVAAGRGNADGNKCLTAACLGGDNNGNKSYMIGMESVPIINGNIVGMLGGYNGYIYPNTRTPNFSGSPYLSWQAGCVWSTNTGSRTYQIMTDHSIAKAPCSLFLGGHYLYDAYGFNTLIQAWDEQATGWTNYTTANTNTVLIWARNGVGINTNDPESALEVGGVVTISGIQTNDPPAPTHGFILYAKNVGGTIEGYVENSAGTVTKITPHKGLTHVALSYNIYNGKGREIDLDELAKAVAQLTGNTNIYREITVPTRNWDADEAARVKASQARHAHWEALKMQYEAAYQKWLKDGDTNEPSPRFDAPEPQILKPRPMPAMLKGEMQR